MKLILKYIIFSILFFYTIFPCTASHEQQKQFAHTASQYTFTNHVGVYDVSKIIQWAKGKGHDCVSLPTSSFLSYLQNDTWSDAETNRTSNLNHLMQKDKQRQRVQEADLSYPIIVTNFYEIVDGTHRLIKAISEGYKVINGIFIENSILETFRISNPYREAESKSTVPGLPISDIYLVVPQHHLPQNKKKRRALIEDYFVEHLPSAHKHEKGWLIQLERPSEAYGCYKLDPKLKLGLDWWRKNTQICDIPASYRLCDKGLLSLEDQWVPYSWSLYFCKLGYLPKELVLLHIDDHQDMMSPRVGELLDGRFVDYITRESFTLLQPDAVKQAILSGSIGKGSILTPLIWSINKIHVRHLAYRSYPHKTYTLVKTRTSDNVISKLHNRISVQTHPDSSPEVSKKSNYLVTNVIKDWIDNIPDGVPILLHIDMDYFNNRFDGNSCWKEEKTRCHDPSLVEQQKRMLEIMNALQGPEILNKIENVTIGISASFFPAEFWQPLTTQLIDEFTKRGINLNHLKS